MNLCRALENEIAKLKVQLEDSGKALSLSLSDAASLHAKVLRFVQLTRNNRQRN